MMMVEGMSIFIISYEKPVNSNHDELENGNAPNKLGLRGFLALHLLLWSFIEIQ